uniref:Uncharacterized protein n=1 Tax=Aegilops tauschii subsp. strangulata TaxID=200361 RepID=A0A453J7W8_AEGTS
MQEIVCGRAGKAFVENTKSCRCECPALIRLQRSNSMDNEHKRTTCPDCGDVPNQARKPAHCKNCGVEGHGRNN